MASRNAILLSVLLVFSISVVLARGRISILGLPSDDDDRLLISDGVDHYRDETRSTGLGATTCNHQYGFLPCAENVPGYIFQIFVYQGLLIFGEKQIDKGSKVLFNMIGDSKIAGVIFRILMALPSMMLMIVSGAFSSKETAQSQVSLGIGIYAGITVFSLTIHWGIILIVGRRNLKDKSNDKAEASELDCFQAKQRIIILKDEGVRIDEETRKTAGIMLLSLIPYVTVQLVEIFHGASANRIITFLALIVSSLSLFSYFVYQIMNPWLQERSLAYSKYDTLRKGFLQHVKRNGQLFTEDGKINTNVINGLFDTTDEDNDERINTSEARKLVLDLIKNGNMQVDEEYAVSTLMEIFDFDDSGSITEQEFIDGCQKWIDEINQSSQQSESALGGMAQEVVQAFKQKKKEDNTPEMSNITSKRALITSLFELILGILILNFLGGPLMGSILQLSAAAGLQSFSISFVIVPFATNARALLAALLPASQKNERSASLTFSEIYGGVIMNNIGGMTMLLAIVYAKELTWNFSAEVLTILVVCAVIGFLANKCTAYPLWTSILAFSLYPISLGFYYFAQVFWSWK